MANRKRPKRQVDRVRDQVLRRMKQLGLSCYAVAKATGGKVAEDTVRRYAQSDKSVHSANLQYIFKALNLKLVPVEHK